MSPSRPQGVPGSLDRYSAPQRLAERAGRRFHVMAKPAGSACNLDCSYCFYLSKQNLPGGPGGGHMDDDLLDRFVQDHIQSVTADEVVFFGKVLVNFCETLVAQHMGLPSQICIHSEVCGKGVALEHDGDVYSCDHYVYPEYRLGNVRERSLGEMVFDPAQVKFGYAKSEALPAYCRECEFLRDCWGECPKNRVLRTPDGEPGLNYLCPGLKRFFAHAVPEAGRIAARLRAPRSGGH